MLFFALESLQEKYMHSLYFPLNSRLCDCMELNWVLLEYWNIDYDL